MKIGKAIDCMAQHIKVFHSQAVDEVTADFGEPCQTCPHVANCNYNWLAQMDPLLLQSQVKISLLIQEPDDTQGKDNDYHALDMDIH